jgi:hypothetical protein
MGNVQSVSNCIFFCFVDPYNVLLLVFPVYLPLRIYLVFSVDSVFKGCRLVTASNVIASSTSMFTSLLAVDSLTIN